MARIKGIINDVNDNISFLAILITQVKPLKNSFAKKLQEYIRPFSKGAMGNRMISIIT